MTGRLWLFAADVTDLPATVPAGDRTAAVLFGVAAIIAAVGGPLVAFMVGRRKANEDEVPRLREDVRNLTRDNEDLRADVLALSRHVFALEQLASSGGQEVPPRPTLRIARARRRGSEEA